MKVKELLAFVNDVEDISIYYRSINGHTNYLVFDTEKIIYDGKYDEYEIVNVGTNLYAVLDIEIKFKE